MRQTGSQECIQPEEIIGRGRRAAAPAGVGGQAEPLRATTPAARREDIVVTAVRDEEQVFDGALKRRAEAMPSRKAISTTRRIRR
jgi:hypothetical protein